MMNILPSVYSSANLRAFNSNSGMYKLACDNIKHIHSHHPNYSVSFCNESFITQYVIKKHTPLCNNF